MTTAAHEFELICEGIKDASADQTAVLKEICSHAGFMILEADALLKELPFVVKRSNSREELENISQSLKKAGAQVLIVRALKERASPGAEQRTDTVASFYKKYTRKLAAIMEQLPVQEVEQFVADLLRARERNRQIFIFGNGGSASSASHFANDFGKRRFDDPNFSFRVMSLNDNVSWLTATANDFGYEQIFSAQLRNLMEAGDLVIAISSSGNSPNVLEAIKYANENGATTYGIVGFDGGKLKNVAKHCIHIPTKRGQYGYMEDVTLILNHVASVFIYERDCELAARKK